MRRKEDIMTKKTDKKELKDDHSWMDAGWLLWCPKCKKNEKAFVEQTVMKNGKFQEIYVLFKCGYHGIYIPLILKL